MGAVRLTLTRSRWIRIVSAIVYIGVGVMFLSGAVEKAIHPQFHRGVFSYYLPGLGRDSLGSALLVLTLASVEALLGAALIARLQPRVFAVCSAILLLFFSVMLVAGWSTDASSISCGCGFLAEHLRATLDSAGAGILLNVVLATGLLAASTALGSPDLQTNGGTT